MLFSLVPRLDKRGAADLCIIPFWSKSEQSKSIPRPVCDLLDIESEIQIALNSGDFTGKERQYLLIYPKQAKEKRLLLLGLGATHKITAERLRLAFGDATRLCIKRGYSKINVLMPTVSDLRNLSVEECLNAVSEGILLANYQFREKSESKEDTWALLKQVTLVGILPKYLPRLELNECIAESVYMARDLINGNADTVTPDFLVASAKTIASSSKSIKIKVLDKEKLEKEGMNLFLAVARGSSYRPSLIVLSYQGNPRSSDHTVFLGKGITFDTGGINLKPTGSVETMRDDMAGAAAVLGILAALPSLDLKINVTALVPTCENAIDANSFKPGDIYKSLSGKSVEVNNTDAEGRLILADAIEYALKYLKPSRLIDFATLTGAMTIALGDQISGLFSNDDKLAEELIEAGKQTGELLWRLPLHAPYKEELKSEIADMKNTAGRPGGAIKAALFLESFANELKWAHIDIAGTAFASKERGYLPQNGIGVGIRLALSYLKMLAK